MTKFKKVLLASTAAVMTAALAIGGTMAYLTSNDSDVNVMTLGNVEIEQLEYQRAEGVAYNAGDAGKGNGVTEGALVPFVNNQALYPAVPSDDTAYTAEATDLFYWGDYVYSGTAGNGLWNDDKLSNVMDKMVFVKNTGKSDAYTRTLIAFECPEGTEYSQGPDKEFMMNTNGSQTVYTWENLGYIAVDGTRYFVMEATYLKALNPGNTAHPSLLQVVMTHNATNEDMELLGDTYEILVLSQAVQTKGFDNAANALETAFPKGEDNKKVAEWFKGVMVENAPETWDSTVDKTWFDAEKAANATAENPVTFEISTAEEFAGFMNLANTNTFENVTVRLERDIDLAGTNWNEGGAIAAYGSAFGGTLDGGGHTIYNLSAANNWTYANGLFRSIGKDTTIKNLVIEDANINNATGSSKNKEYGVLVGIVGSGTLTIENVTIRNSSVSCKNAAGILVGGMTEGAIRCKNVIIENCDIAVSSESGKGGAVLGDGWSHHDYDYAGVYTENVKLINCTYTVAGVLQKQLPLYNYVK